MPPRAPGTLSNGTLSLKFMQRGLAADQKPVEAEKAQFVDDSHWEIAHPPEKKALLNTEHQKGFDVTYEASYIPFLYGPESSVSDDTPGSSSTPLGPVSGRRTFRGGQEVWIQTEIAANPQEGHEGELRYSSPTASEEMNNEPPKDNGSRNSQAPKQEKPAQPRPVFRKDRVLPPTNYAGDGKPQFLRPADVDVPERTTGAYPAGGKGKSKRDTLAEMIASAKLSQHATGSSSPSTPANDEANGQSALRRKASAENEESRPRKKLKKNKGATNP